MSVHPLMNDTKWDELRKAMHGLHALKPRWRTRDVDTGYLSEWDRDWFYHFRSGGYASIQWVEIAVETDEQRAAVLAELVRINVPGEATAIGYRVVGHAAPGHAVDYIR
jgi:hypothetical protein